MVPGCSCSETQDPGQDKPRPVQATMNYLAHLYFADDSPKSLIGNLLGDFVKGKASHQYTDKVIIDGIALHRAIDKYTDSHPIVIESKSRISAKRRRFSGIMIDVFYDHFLARQWKAFSSSDFDTQIRQWYADLNAEIDIHLPENMKVMMHKMIKHDWFTAYRSLDGISASINGISKRIRFDNQLAGGAVELTDNYTELQDDFYRFFPQLKHYVKTIQS